VGKAASPVDEAAPRCVHCREDLLSAGKEHHFGCPVYVLNKDIQDEKKAKRWIDVTRIGINLGPSPRHASSVALILNLKSGLVSPQFHCQYDDCCESTTGTQARSMPQSVWQQKCGFSLNHNSEDDGDTARQSEPTKVTTNMSSPLSQFKMIYPHLKNITHLRNNIEQNQEEHLSHLND
jgi:hypothetical protein